jgi:hypothetical protein
MKPQVGFLFVVTLALATSRLAAQDSLVRATIDSGTLIRMHPVAGSPVKGRLLQPLGPSSTVVQYCRYPAPPCTPPIDSADVGRYPMASLTRIEVQRGSHWAVGAAAGGALGVLIGGLVAVAVAIGCGEAGDCPSGAVVMGIPIALFGAMGGFIGSGSPKWVAAP